MEVFEDLCEGDKLEIESNHEDLPICKICGVSGWSLWGDCSATCLKVGLDATRTRNRTCMCEQGAGNFFESRVAYFLSTSYC